MHVLLTVRLRLRTTQTARSKTSVQMVSTISLISIIGSYDFPDDNDAIPARNEVDVNSTNVGEMSTAQNVRKSE